jgi:hypothetical protein
MRIRRNASRPWLFLNNRWNESSMKCAWRLHSRGVCSAAGIPGSKERSFVPLGEARLGRIGFDEWLRRLRADPASANRRIGAP